jgi:hypothetical protein
MKLLREMLNKIKVAEPPASLEFRVKPDFWVEPKAPERRKKKNTTAAMSCRP